jgi:hypothetical protein
MCNDKSYETRRIYFIIYELAGGSCRALRDSTMAN